MPFNLGNPNHQPRTTGRSSSPASHVDWEAVGRYFDAQDQRAADRAARMEAEAEQAELDAIEANGGLAAVVAAGLGGGPTRPADYRAPVALNDDDGLGAAVSRALGINVNINGSNHV